MVMVVGLSISHSPPGSDLPSVVSATFSCDDAVYRYLHCVRLQEKGIGLISAPLLKEMMIEGCKVSFFLPNILNTTADHNLFVVIFLL